jgi:hypothetical protein
MLIASLLSVPLANPVIFRLFIGIFADTVDEPSLFIYRASPDVYVRYPVSPPATSESQ